MKHKQSLLRAVVGVLFTAVTTQANIVAQWNLNEGSGTNVFPVIGSVTGRFDNSHSANGNGVKWNPAFPPLTSLSPIVSPTNSLQFGNNGNSVQIPDDNSLDTGSITVAFWSKEFFTGFNNAGGVLVAKNDASSHSWEFGFGSSGGNLFFRTFVGGSSVFAGNTAANPFTSIAYEADAWHLFVGTFDAATGATSLYVDGALKETINNTAGSLNNSTAAVTLGGRGAVGGISAGFGGLIGGPLVIWDNALTASQVAALPEPTSAALMAMSLLAFFARRRA